MSMNEISYRRIMLKYVDEEWMPDFGLQSICRSSLPKSGPMNIEAKFVLVELVFGSEIYLNMSFNKSFNS